MQDTDQIIPKEHLARRNYYTNFIAFKPTIVKLQSDKRKWYIMVLEFYKFIKYQIIEFYEDFDNHLGKPPLALRIVPLPDFTTNSNRKKLKHKYKKTKSILNIFWMIFIPLWYKLNPRWFKWFNPDENDENKLSPFSRMILYENNDDIYDNPAIQAIIDFRWKRATDSFFSLSLRFLIFASCFTLTSWSYLDDNKNINEKGLIASIFIFYYMALYLFVTEILQLYYRGPRKYFKNFYNYFDVISIVLPVIAMSVLLKNFKFSTGFESVDPDDTRLTALISFSNFILWIQFVGLTFFNLYSFKKL
jgi:hypothetical protein